MSFYHMVPDVPEILKVTDEKTYIKRICWNVNRNVYLKYTVFYNVRKV